MKRVVVVVALTLTAGWCASVHAVNKCIGVDGRVTFQDSPCPNASRSAEKLSPKENVPGRGDGGAASPGVPNSEAATIHATCAKAFPRDPARLAGCLAYVTESFRKTQRQAPVEREVSTSISDKCARDWPDDFRMRAFCEKQQAEGVRAVESPIDAPPQEARIIRTKCARDWPDDFRMRAYCEKQQLEGLRTVQR